VGPPIGAGVRHRSHVVRADHESFDSAPCAVLVASESIPRTSADRRVVDLLTFTIGRDDICDRLELAVELDAHPGVEFSYRQGIRLVGEQPDLSANTAAAIFMASFLERTVAPPPAVDGRVDLMTVLPGDPQ
jgi:hypothetical protein